MSKTTQASDTIHLGVILAISGGFMDAYSYLGRDHVFANAQTGNIILFGVNLMEGNFPTALRYLCPMLAFTIGIILSNIVRHKCHRDSFLHWRQITVLMEILILSFVAYIPQNHNLYANSLISMACGIQVECFRKMHKYPIATTMCIGNLRSGTQSLCDYFLKNDKTGLKKALLYYGIIFNFILGAVLGSFVIKFVYEKSILLCSFMLLIVFFMMFSKNQEQED